MKAYTHAQRRYVPGSSYFSNAQISTKFTGYINKQKNVANSKKPRETNPKAMRKSDVPNKEF